MSTALFPEEPLELGELTHDAITSRYRIWQRKRGHRYSLDDVLTAWEAAQAAPENRRRRIRPGLRAIHRTARGSA